MDFPTRSTIADVLDVSSFPTFAEVRYDPAAPEVSDVTEETHQEVDALVGANVPDGATIAVGLGSRGIHDIVTIAKTVIERLENHGFEPVVIPAMGSHGGATAAGQRETLAALGLTEDQLGCPINSRMDTKVIGETAFGEPVYFAKAALEADATMVVNRVKPHTNFDGEIESGLCKMLTVGLGKQDGAQAIHEQALVHGYVPTIETALDVIRAEIPFIGGVAIIENFYDRTAAIEGIPATSLPDRESDLLEDARTYMPTLPYDELDVLVVDRIGKDISGAGMDTNVIGRYRVLNADEPDTPDIDRIVVRGLTEAAHGNGQGIGLADITTADVASQLDFEQMYTNALTSSSLSKARLPIVLPTNEQALAAAVSTVGSYDPERIRIAWIQDTSHLSSFKVSEGLVDEDSDDVHVEGYTRLTFEDGDPVFEPLAD